MPASSLQPPSNCREVLHFTDGLYAHALEILADKTQEPHQRVHGVRVTIKRIRALLLLLRPCLTKHSFNACNRELRSPARRLSKLREFHVARDQLSAFLESKSALKDRTALRTVLEALEALTGENLKNPDKRLAEAASALKKSRRRVSQLETAGDDGQLATKGLCKLYREGRQRMKHALRSQSAEAMHGWRIRVKNLYYVLEMLGASHPGPPEKLMRRLGKLQQKLGCCHDLADLHKRLSREPGRFGGAHAVGRVLSLLECRAAKLRQSAARLGSKVYKPKPQRFLKRL